MSMLTIEVKLLNYYGCVVNKLLHICIVSKYNNALVYYVLFFSPSVL